MNALYVRLVVVVLSSVILLVVGSEGEAAAQVNAEALRSKLRANPTFLWVDAALVGRTGNTETMTFAGSIFGGLTSEPHLFFTRVSADYGTARGRATVARWMAHARYNYRLTSIVSLEALAQVQHDRFRRIAVRDLYGAGLRFDVFRTEDIELFSGTTYILEHEAIEAIPGSPSSNDIWHRSSSYIGLNGHLAALVDASSVTYVQPRWDRPSDFRILSESFVAFTITKILSARVSGTVWFDNEPPFGVRTYDLEIKNSLALKLQ